MTSRSLIIALVILLSACMHSPRKHYFALSAALPVTTTELQAVSVQQVVGIGPVKIPEYLQHSRIAYWKTAQQLSSPDNGFWAEPLEQGITRVLALNLQAAQPQWRVMQFPWSQKRQPTLMVRVDIQRLDAFKNYALLEATLDVVNTTTQTTRSKVIRTQIASSADSASIAAAFSQLLQQASTAIAAEIL